MHLKNVSGSCEAKGSEAMNTGCVRIYRGGDGPNQLLTTARIQHTAKPLLGHLFVIL